MATDQCDQMEEGDNIPDIISTVKESEMHTVDP